MFYDFRNTGTKPPASSDVKSSTAMSLDSSSGALAVAENMALVKSSSEKVKTTPAGEYLTNALNDFNPDQQSEGSAASDGANKLLMLVGVYQVQTCLM